jgi:hypothetical protein
MTAVRGIPAHIAQEKTMMPQVEVSLAVQSPGNLSSPRINSLPVKMQVAILTLEVWI